MDPNASRIIIPKLSKQEKTAFEAVIMERIPLRIKCPNPHCQEIYTLYVENFDQGLHCLLGQACPNCKRFIRESDDPEKLLIDAKEIREMIQAKERGNA